MLTSLDRIGVCVRDVSEATRAYASLLGRSPTWRGRSGGGGSEHAIFRLGNVSIELVSPGEGPGSESTAPADAVARRLAAHGEGVAFLAFATDDAADASARCREAGLDAPAPRDALTQDSDSGAFRRMACVDLPPKQTGGVPIQLVEHRSPDALLSHAPPTCAERAAAATLDHVVVMTGAPERAIALYRDRLGIRLALDRTFARRGVRLLFFRIGGATVEVGSSLAEAPPAAGADPGDDRLFGVAYRVADVDAARARLAEADVDVTDVRVGHKPGTRVFTVRAGTCGVPTLFIGDG